jgi:glucuronosyltransferase
MAGRVPQQCSIVLYIGEQVLGREKSQLKQSIFAGHPNVLAFLSHGGLLSMLEASYSGVPVVGIPFYGDQKTNLANIQARGMGIQLQYHNITKESVLEALHTVLEQPR